MDARDIIIRPVITEQSVFDMDDKKYTFIVDPRANRSHIKHAIEELFDVDVKKVNAIKPARKRRPMCGYQRYRKSRKEAIVTLTDASADIEILGESNDEE